MTTRDVDGGTHLTNGSVPFTMALAAALGGLSLGSASLSSRTLGCTDGLRVRCAVQWPALLPPAAANAPRSPQAQAMPALAAPLRTVTTAEVRVRGDAPAA